MIIPHDDICTFYKVSACGIFLAFVPAREVGVSSRNVVSRTFPHFPDSMLTPMLLAFRKRKS